MARPTAAPAAVLCLLAGVVLVSEAWGGFGEGDDDGDAAGGRRREVLEKLSQDEGLLINLDPWDLPATSDIVRLGRPATPAVINGLVNSMSPEVRTTCAQVLTATRDPRALDPLIDALDDPEDEVRSLAIQALGSIESRKATPRLLALVGRAGVPAYVRESAVQALGRLGDPAAVRPLRARFRSTWDPATQLALWDLRAHLKPAELAELVVAPMRAPPDAAVPYEVLAFSVERAGDLRLRAAVPHLVRLADGSPDLQNRVIYNLGRIGDRGAVPFLRGLLDRTAEARLLNNVVFALQRLGEDPAPFLRDALADRRAYIRFNAAFVAGDLGLKAVVPELIAGLSDANDYVRSEVAVALGKIADPSAGAALEAASREPNVVVRRDALLALARIDYERHRERVVTELLASPVRSVRQGAVSFLAERGDPAVVSAVLATLDPGRYDDLRLGTGLLDRFDRLENPDGTAWLLRGAAGSGGADAVRLLARHRDERAVFALRQWLTQPAGRQDQMLRALGRLADPHSEGIARWWLTGRDVSAQLHAGFLLASLGRKEGADRLLAALEDAPVELKRTAATLLTELDLSRVEGLPAALAAMLDHPDVYVRLYAARALVEGDDRRAWERLRAELDKKVPFVRDEVLDIVDRAPARHRDPVLRAWARGVDPLLRQDLERVVGPIPPG